MRTRIAMAMAFVICGIAAGPTFADHDDDHHRGRRGHERHERWHGHRRHFFRSSEPDVYYYAPPPVLYTPAYPSPGINLVLPLRIR